MNKIPDIDLRDYDYPLPPDRIAQYPLENRDDSKLLICTDDGIREDVFHAIHQYIPDQSLLVFNNTRVIRARLIFSKSTGATIEIFSLDPLLPTREIQEAFQQTNGCTWKCLVGNVKRWKGEILKKEFTHLRVK